MEFIAQEEFTQLFLQYGSIALFGLLALGIIILPVPDESLMVLAGILMRSGYLKITPTILAAIGGSISGITVSYFLGRTAGHYLLKNYGRFVGITEKKMNAAHRWFEKYGKWTLVFGYFIPGIRHVTGILAGTSELAFRTFACFAYLGAVVWATTFLSAGYFLGPYWAMIFDAVEAHISVAVLAAVILAGMAYLLKKFSKKKKQKKKDS